MDPLHDRETVSTPIDTSLPAPIGKPDVSPTEDEDTQPNEHVPAPDGTAPDETVAANEGKPKMPGVPHPASIHLIRAGH
jgi:hypothetical protein